MGQQLSDAPCEIATLTFNLGGHGACWWYKSSYSIYEPSLTFVGLSARKIRCTSDLSTSRRDDLDLWHLTLKLVRVIAGVVDNLPSNFGISRTFCSRLMGQQLSSGWRDLATLTFDACQWYRSSYTIRVPSLKFVGLRVRKTLRIYLHRQHSINF